MNSFVFSSLFNAIARLFRATLFLSHIPSITIILPSIRSQNSAPHSNPSTIGQWNCSSVDKENTLSIREIRLILITHPPLVVLLVVWNDANTSRVERKNKAKRRPILLCLHPPRSTTPSSSLVSD